MPLSSVVGAQSIIRPGVCTSSTRPASPYDGQVIYETDTDRTLVWNGTGWVFLSTSRANAGGLDLIKTQTIGSAVSSVVVSDAFSSTYDNYKIVINGGTASTAENVSLKLGSTATGYYWVTYLAQYSSTGVIHSRGANDPNFQQFGFCNTDGIFMNVDVVGPNTAKPTFVTGINARNVTTGYGGPVSGYLADSTQYTAFTIAPNSGTLTGGTIRVYGYANS